jgi:hypothetical protein
MRSIDPGFPRVLRGKHLEEVMLKVDSLILLDGFH